MKTAQTTETRKNDYIWYKSREILSNVCKPKEESNWDPALLFKILLKAILSSYFLKVNGSQFVAKKVNDSICLIIINSNLNKT